MARHSIVTAIVVACGAVAIVPSVGYADGINPRLNGFYVGGVAAFTQFSADVSQTVRTTGAVVDLGEDSASGFGYGVVIGYQRAIDDRWLVGIEGDWVHDAHDVAFANGPGTPVGSADAYMLEHWGTIRARIGYALTSSVILSASAGIAIVDYDYVDNDTALSTNGSEHALGWVAGGAADLALTDGIVLRVEGLYVGMTDWSVIGDQVVHNVGSDIAVARSALIWNF